MSSVIDFYQQHPLGPGDALHKALDEVKPMHDRLQEIRRDMLCACGCDVVKNEVKLCVVDKETFGRLEEERADIMTRLGRIDALVCKLDAVFADAEKQQILIDRKTPKGILDLECEWRKVHRGPDPEPWNPNTRDKGLANPDLVALLERATAAMHEAGIAF